MQLHTECVPHFLKWQKWINCAVSQQFSDWLRVLALLSSWAWARSKLSTWPSGLSRLQRPQEAVPHRCGLSQVPKFKLYLGLCFSLPVSITCPDKGTDPYHKQYNPLNILRHTCIQNSGLGEWVISAELIGTKTRCWLSLPSQSS